MASLAQPSLRLQAEEGAEAEALSQAGQELPQPTPEGRRDCQAAAQPTSARRVNQEAVAGHRY